MASIRRVSPAPAPQEPARDHRCGNRPGEFRVDEDVTILVPHRPGRADFPHPVLHAYRNKRNVLGSSWTDERAVLGMNGADSVCTIQSPMPAHAHMRMARAVSRPRSTPPGGARSASASCRSPSGPCSFKTTTKTTSIGALTKPIVRASPAILVHELTARRVAP